MNFFEHQDKARKQSTRLLFLFLLAVSAVVFFTAIVITGTLTYFQTQGFLSNASSHMGYWAALLHNPILLWSLLGTLIFIILGSAFKALQLGGNGIQVALAMNGKHVHPDTHNPDYQKLLNIVTEMALASGNPVPKVFVMPGAAINAFAAGFNRHQTVVAVTEGALTQLSRNELQGVIAHEFSHINFGDVKINMRIVALLHGILLIGIIGRYIAWGSYGHYGHRSSSRRNSKQAGLGFALMAIGFTGTFFGNLIKAAVSRQREYLADASAVQFTRNPDGIANALKKIAQGPDATLESSHAEEFSHFYFSSLRLTGVQNFFSGLLATHPEIDKRIERLGHTLTLDIRNPPHHATQANNTAQPNSQVMGFARAAEPASRATFTSTIHTIDNNRPSQSPSAQYATLKASNIIDSIGNPTHSNLDAAQAHLASLPTLLVDACSNPFSARALIYGLLIQATAKKYHSAQLDHLKTHAHPETVKTLQQLQPAIAQLNPQNFYPLLLLAEPTLQDQSTQQADTFQDCAKALIKVDNQLSLLEWAIYRLAVAPLRQFKNSRQKNLQDCQSALNVLFYYTLSLTEPAQRAPLLAQAEKHLRLTITKPQKVSLNALDGAMNSIAQLKPLSKPALIKALIACIIGDGEVTEEETTLLRMVALILDCPIPERFGL
ncbi:M48 family metallopeptidase [Marinagarivorans algicola]|uniref:M48 family metallopeptidase n=1 Tax=Marinagarivorans algicola TaxID=1513270 RepID=UPI0006B9765C|nr:M48 family metallopeptidase [Marinagarivorans algicola]